MPFVVDDVATFTMLWTTGTIVVLITGMYLATRGSNIKPLSSQNSSRLKIGILGMPGSGKTSLLRFLDKKEHNVGGQSFDEPYDAFDYNMHDEEKSTIYIKEGIDVPGAKESRLQHMAQFLDEKDALIYVFNIYEYMEGVNCIEYEKETNADLEFINSHIRYKNGNLKVCVLMSHFDYYKSDKKKAQALDAFKKKFRKHCYSQVLFNNYAPVNITDDEQLIKIEKKLFP